MEIKLQKDLVKKFNSAFSTVNKLELLQHKIASRASADADGWMNFRLKP